MNDQETLRDIIRQNPAVIVLVILIFMLVSFAFMLWLDT